LAGFRFHGILELFVPSHSARQGRTVTAARKLHAQGSAFPPCATAGGAKPKQSAKRNDGAIKDLKVIRLESGTGASRP